MSAERPVNFGRRDDLTSLYRDALRYHQTQVSEASAVLAKARADLQTYVRENPGSNTQSDSHLKRLADLQGAALERLDSATAAFDQASADALSPTSAQGRLRIVDPPTLPTGPIWGLKRVALALFAGFFAGAIISVLGVVALVAISRRMRDGRWGRDRGRAALARLRS